MHAGCGWCFSTATDATDATDSTDTTDASDATDTVYNTYILWSRTAEATREHCCQ